MAQNGWHLRSGYADGADQAWGLGAAQQAEISDIDRWTMYLPWRDYNNAPRDDERFKIAIINSEAEFIAKTAYNTDPLIQKGKPHWDETRNGTKLLMIRNVIIVLGENLKTPVDCVLCWTQDGKGEGGTGHAMRVAHTHQIPVFDLALEEDRVKASEFVYDAESEYWGIPF